FGWGRHTNRLSSEAKPLTFGEIDREVKIYSEYYKNFSFKQAANPKLSFFVLPNDRTADFTNLDKWYERYNKEEVGIYTLYKLKLKDENPVK
ncbi:MAG: hypothetical protein ACR2J3_09855, partial [Aridibacter sp.]